MANLPPELADLCARAQRAREKTAAVSADLQQTRSETRHMLALAHQTRPIDWCVSSAPDALAPFTKLDPNSHEAAYAAAMTIRSILDEFPLHWQVAIVKALGASTAILAQQRKQTPPALSA